MSEITDIIDALAATTKRTEKERILLMAGASRHADLIKKIFVATYDNSFNYWVKEFPMPETFLGSIDLEAAINRLDAVKNRLITGNAAIAEVTNIASLLSSEEAVVFANIVKRDLRCGMTSGTANKVWPGLIYEHPYMRCSSFNEKNLSNIKFPAFSQTKADGLYIDVVIQKDGSSKAMTRSGQVLNIIPGPLATHLSLYPGKVLMGEALILKEDGSGYLSRKEGNGILNSDDVPLDRVVFVLWDAVDLDDWKAGKSKKNYQDRLNDLTKMIPDYSPEYDLSYQMKLVNTRIVNSVEEVISHFKEEVEKGEEGTVLKDFSGLWGDGTSKYQVKIKIEFECDLVIVGWKEGKGKHKGKLGAFNFQSSDGLVDVWAGGGYSDAQRAAFFAVADSMIGKVGTLKSNDLIQNRNNLEIWSLFLPRFIEIRTDKTESDSFDRVKEQRDDFVNILKAIK